MSSSLVLAAVVVFGVMAWGYYLDKKDKKR